MQRLLADAQKITGVKYDIKNLSDVYSAIHVVQDKLGVAGATADEAEKTFSGSFSAMKASWQNLMGNMATGGDVSGAMSQLISSASTFLLKNALPMIGNVFKSLPKAIKTALPKVKEAGGELAKSLKDGLVAILPSSVGEVVEKAFTGLGNINFGGIMETFSNLASSAMPIVEATFTHIGAVVKAVMPIVTSLVQIFSKVVQTVFPIISNVIASAMTVVTPIVTAFAGLIQSAMPIVSLIMTTVTNVIASVAPVFTSIFESIGSKVREIIGVVQSHMPLLQKIFETVCPIVEGAIVVVRDIISSAWTIISPIIDLAIQIFDSLLSCVEKCFPTIQGIVEGVWSVLEGIFGGIADGLSKIGDGIGTVAGWIGDGLGAVGNFFGFAYGKDRVPYDNYPAVLHQGEKVLTRNQADQYDRQMSTRGVQLNKAVQEVPRSESTGTSTGNGQEVQEIKNAGTTVNIEKLADTVVIEKEADVDKVVEDMVNKFRKLVPNIA